MPPTLACHPPHPCYTCQHTTHASTPPTLVRHPRQYVTHASTSPTRTCYSCQHVTHASMPPMPHTLACHYASMPPMPLTVVCHPRKHTTHSTYASTSLMQAHHPHHPCQHRQHTISQTPNFFFEGEGLKIFQPNEFIHTFQATNGNLCLKVVENGQVHFIIHLSDLKELFPENQPFL